MTKSILNSGAIVGITIGCIIVAVLLTAAFLLVRRKRAASHSVAREAFPQISAPIQRIPTTASQLPNPTIGHLNDKSVEKLYLKEATRVGDSNSNAAETFIDTRSRAAPRGQHSSLILPHSTPKQVRRLEAATNERRNVPYRPDDFA